MTVKRLFPLLLLVLSLLPGVAQADALTPQKEADIKKLITISKAGSSLQSLMPMRQLRAKAFAEKMGVVVTEEVQLILDKTLQSTHEDMMRGPGGFFDQLVPIYADMLTHDEVRQYIAFYESPTGRKVADSTGEFGQKSGFALVRTLGAIDEALPASLLDALTKNGLIKPEKQ